MKIRKYNEGVSTDYVWIAIEFNDGFYQSSTVFSSEMKAWDYYLKIVNLIRKYVDDTKPFERYYENGVRLFRTIEENSDLEKAKNWVLDNFKDEQFTVEIEKKEIK